MVEVATYVRIFATTPGDELVEKRTNAVKDLGAKFMKDAGVSSILQFANDVALAVDAKAKIPPEFAEHVQASVRKTAVSFVAAEANLEVTVCGLMAALQVLQGAKPGDSVLTKQELFAIGLWSALSYQPPRAEPKLEELRAATLDAARHVVLKAGHTSRERLIVPDVKTTLATDANAPAFAAAVDEAAKPVVHALRHNAQLDREELDLLWWVLGDWSEVLDVRYDHAPNKASAAIASGLEAGAILRRVPLGAHRNLVLRQAAPPADEATLPELLKRLGTDRGPLAASFESMAYVSDMPAVFPLLSGLRTGASTDPKSRLKRSLGEWAERALLERAILGVVSVLSKAGK